ncbi:MAG: hypothetical protein NC397_04590 [Clostridium sp.]|nr:hypothetical protein [Clostridium sp.]
MEYRLGNSIKVKSRGETLELTCPCCKKKSQFGVFSNFERRLAAKITLLDLSTVYFLVCPECASVFTVDQENGEKFRKGDLTAIIEEDLKELTQFKSKI